MERSGGRQHVGNRRSAPRAREECMDVVMHHPPLNLDNLGNRHRRKDGLIDEVRREVPPATKDSSQSLQTSDTTVGIGVAESSGFARDHTLDSSCSTNDRRSVRSVGG